MNKLAIAAGAAGLLLLAGCASAPTGPSVLVLPGTGKNFDQFRGDEAMCRQYAAQQTGTTANEAGVDAGVKSAAVGTVIGAAAGAAIGGRGGAAVGAGTGLAVGAAAGTDAARSSSYGTQRMYDNAYIQCMYSMGHRVPVPAGMVAPAAPASAAPPPPPSSSSAAPAASMPPPPPAKKSN